MEVMNHHPLVNLARATIEAYVRERRTLTPSEAPEPVDGRRAGVFVTLHLCSTGDLRGCIGTIQATEPTLAEEVIHNAIAAAVSDRRFAPVGPEELADLDIEVSVLHPAEHIESLDQLDPLRYGVIVQRGRRRGLLLPEIPGIDDARTQVEMARQKAWIGQDEPIEMWRFQVDKFL
jgi:AmmeMemoRadiSam system protein A